MGYGGHNPQKGTFDWSFLTRVPAHGLVIFDQSPGAVAEGWWSRSLFVGEVGERPEKVLPWTMDIDIEWRGASRQETPPGMREPKFEEARKR
jgi:hypothetical protein